MGPPYYPRRHAAMEPDYDRIILTQERPNLRTHFPEAMLSQYRLIISLWFPRMVIARCWYGTGLQAALESHGNVRRICNQHKLVVIDADL